MNRLPLVIELRQLDEATEELKTGDVLRDAELKNISAIVKLLVNDCLTRRVGACQLLIEKNTLEERLNVLAENPEFAGNHEIHRIHIQKSNDNQPKKRTGSKKL